MSAVPVSALSENFSEYGFTDVYPHSSGDIPFKTLKFEDPSNGGMIIMWGIKKGASYPPESHKHPRILFVVKGHGIIISNGDQNMYEMSSVFRIGPNEPQGFIKVLEDTVVIEVVPPKPW